MRGPKEVGHGYVLASRVFLAIYFLVVFVPLATVLVWAVVDRWPWPNLLPDGFSLRGIQEIFNDYSPNGEVLLTSILIAVCTSVLSVVIGILASRALVHYDFPGKTLFRFSAVLPFLVPTTVFAMGTQVAFLKLGLANTAVGVVIAHTIVALPYAVLILYDVVEAAGKRLEEQAQVLGANLWQRVRYVILPSLVPGILSALSMSYIISFSQYFLTLIIGGGRIKTFAVVMFPFLASGDRTIASAYGATFLIVNLAVFLLFELLLRRFGIKRRQNLFEG